MKDTIKVIYTGVYPNVCSGNLIIYRNEEVIYKTDDYSFYSTGGIYFDENWEEHIKKGKLVWENKAFDKFKFWLNKQKDKQEITQKVEEILNKINVCCGGCI